LIVTNVPGPPEVRYLAGARIEEIYPYAPVVVGLPLSIALLSYADTYGIGIDTDPAAIPDPDCLHRFLEEAADEVERAVPAGHRAGTTTRKPPASRTHPETQLASTTGKPAKAIATSSAG
jgi:hypothetical protein